MQESQEFRKYFFAIVTQRGDQAAEEKGKNLGNEFFDTWQHHWPAGVKKIAEPPTILHCEISGDNFGRAAIEMVDTSIHLGLRAIIFYCPTSNYVIEEVVKYWAELDQPLLVAYVWGDRAIGLRTDDPTRVIELPADDPVKVAQEVYRSVMPPITPRLRTEADDTCSTTGLG